MVKNILQEAAHPVSVHQPAQQSEFQTVVNDIMHFDAVVFRDENVQMMPEAIGAETLLIDKIIGFFDMGDLCNPCPRDPQHGVNPENDDHAGVHLFRQ